MFIHPYDQDKTIMKDINTRTMEILRNIEAKYEKVCGLFNIEIDNKQHNILKYK